MTSNVLIPLSNYSRYEFLLKFNNIDIPLPTAGVDRIDIVESDGVQWAKSNIYIYM